MLLLLRSYQVRSVACSILPHLLHAAAESPDLQHQVAPLWGEFQKALLKAAEEEMEFEVLSWQIEALKVARSRVGRPVWY